MGTLGSVDDCHEVITNPRWRFSETLQLKLCIYRKDSSSYAFPTLECADIFITCQFGQIIQKIDNILPQNQSSYKSLLHNDRVCKYSK